MKQSTTSKKESAASAGFNQEISRIITAFIGIPFLVILLYTGSIIFLAALIIIVTSCFFEYLNLLRVNKKLNYLAAFVGLTYVFLLLNLYLILRLKEGQILVLFTFIGTWAFDTAAYYVGSTWGEHKIVPRISSEKSLEGVLAGIGAVSITAIFFPSTLNLVVLPSTKLIWIVALSFSAFLGDLIESSFKRWVGVKDASRLLPGHGGFLDRFDSLILVSFFSYLIFRWLL